MDDDVFRVALEDTFDLHAFAADEVVAVAEEYLYAAYDAGLTVVRLIHGRGKGVQRAAVHRMLRDHPAVEGYVDAPESHLGATVVRVKTRPPRDSTQ